MSAPKKLTPPFPMDSEKYVRIPEDESFRQRFQIYSNALRMRLFRYRLNPAGLLPVDFEMALNKKARKCSV